MPILSILVWGVAPFEGDVWSSAIGSPKDMYVGLLANILGWTAGKLKSIFIWLSLAAGCCGCEESSKTFKTAGSKGIIEPKLKSNGGGTGDWPFGVGLFELGPTPWKWNWSFAFGVGELYDGGA